jgi:hypothetical protein
VVDFYASL